MDARPAIPSLSMVLPGFPFSGYPSDHAAAVPAAASLFFLSKIAAVSAAAAAGAGGGAAAAPLSPTSPLAGPFAAVDGAGTGSGAGAFSGAGLKYASPAEGAAGTGAGTGSIKEEANKSASSFFNLRKDGWVMIIYRLVR